MTTALLSVRDLSIDFTVYGQRMGVLRSVSFDVPARRHVALVGESGCGKSVTMRAIMGILRMPPASILSGSIGFDGQDLVTLAPRARQKLQGTAMSMVFQDPLTSLNPVFTIGDQMDAILKYADRRFNQRRSAAERMSRIHETLAQVHMPDPPRITRAYPIMLSGGMRQRVLIAMALLSRPRLLIADEPGAALDVTTQAQILKLLQELVDDHHMALLMITHSLGVVREAAHDVYVMYAGTVVEHAPTAELFANPRHPYTRALIECVPKLSGDSIMRGIDGAPPDYMSPPAGCRFAPRCAFATGICATTPVEREVAPGHGVACWHAERFA